MTSLTFSSTKAHSGILLKCPSLLKIYRIIYNGKPIYLEGMIFSYAFQNVLQYFVPWLYNYAPDNSRTLMK